MCNLDAFIYNTASWLNLHYDFTVSCTESKFRVYKNAALNSFMMNKVNNSCLTLNPYTTFTWNYLVCISYTTVIHKLQTNYKRNMLLETNSEHSLSFQDHETSDTEAVFSGLRPCNKKKNGVVLHLKSLNWLRCMIDLNFLSLY